MGITKSHPWVRIVKCKNISGQETKKTSKSSGRNEMRVAWGKEREEKHRLISEVKTKLQRPENKLQCKLNKGTEGNQENSQEDENGDKEEKGVGEEVKEMEDRQRRLNIIGVPEEEVSKKWNRTVI